MLNKTQRKQRSRTKHKHKRKKRKLFKLSRQTLLLTCTVTLALFAFLYVLYSIMLLQHSLQEEQQQELQVERDWTSKEHNLESNVQLLTTELANSETSVTEMRTELKRLRHDAKENDNNKKIIVTKKVTLTPTIITEDVPLPPLPPPPPPPPPPPTPPPPQPPPPRGPRLPLNKVWKELLQDDPTSHKIIDTIFHGIYHRSESHFTNAIQQLAQKYANYLTKEERLNQLIIIESVFGQEQQILPCVLNGDVGGLFLARSNDVHNVHQIKQRLTMFSNAHAKKYGSMLPLLLSSDDEGGHRLNYPHVYQTWPSLMTIGAINKPSTAYNYGRGYGADLYSIGQNIVFSPDSDVNTEPSNPVIGPRSFGSSSDVVSTMVNSTIHGFLDAGIFPTLKHFPGHGATVLDSHIGLPTVHGTLQTELAPFLNNMRTASNPNGAPLIMSAHVLAQTLDPKNPISISKKALLEYLRKSLGFSGVIVSDALNMGGLVNFLNVGQGVSRVKQKVAVYTAALFAGNDLLLDSSSSARCLQNDELELVREGVLLNINSKTKENRLLDACAHVLQLKLEIWATHIALKHRIKHQKHRTPTASVLHLFRGDGRNFPVVTKNTKHQRILFVVPNTLSSVIKNATYPLSFHTVLANATTGRTVQLRTDNDVRTIEYHAQPSCHDEKNIIEAVEWSSIAIIMLHNYNTDRNVLMHHVWPEQIDLVRALAERFHNKIIDSRLRMVVISNENPYDLRYLSGHQSTSHRAGKSQGKSNNNINKRSNVRGSDQILAAEELDFMKHVVLMSSYDSSLRSMTQLGIDLKSKVSFEQVSSFLDVGFDKPLDFEHGIPNRPCPDQSGFKGNDPADHKHRWSKEERMEKESAMRKRKVEDDRRKRKYESSRI